MRLLHKSSFGLSFLKFEEVSGFSVLGPRDVVIVIVSPKTKVVLLFLQILNIILFKPWCWGPGYLDSFTLIHAFLTGSSYEALKSNKYELSLFLIP